MGSLFPCTLSSTTPSWFWPGDCTSISGSDESQVLSPKCLFLYFSSLPLLQSMLSPASQVDGHWPGDIFAVQWPVSQPLVGSLVFSKLSCLSLLGISILLLCYFRSASLGCRPAGRSVGRHLRCLQFARPVHLLDVCGTSNIRPFLGCEDCCWETVLA